MTQMMFRSHQMFSWHGTIPAATAMVSRASLASPYHFLLNLGVGRIRHSLQNQYNSSVNYGTFNMSLLFSKNSEFLKTNYVLYNYLM